MANESQRDKNIKEQLRKQIIEFFRKLDQEKYPDGIDYDHLHGWFLRYQSHHTDAVLHDLLDEEFLVHGTKHTNLKLNHVENVE